MAKGAWKPIQINDLILSNNIGGIRTAKNALDTSVSKVPKVSSCKGIKVSDYEAKVREISKLLDLYKKLLEKDLNDTKGLKDRFVAVDIEIGKMLRRTK